MRLSFDADRAGTTLVVLLTVITVAACGVVVTMKAAASDLHLQMDIAGLQAGPATRSPMGRAATALLASDVPTGDFSALEVRASDLDHHADRLLEATAVVALVGMLVGLLVTPPASARRRAREQTIPLAKTSRTGTV
jgi:hypothetical protein